MRSAGILAILFMLLAGCAVKIVPEPVAAGTINPAEGSQTVNRDGIVITAKNSDTEIYSYNMEGTVSAFFVAIENNTTHEATFGPDSFLLVDNEGVQYTPLTPEKVKEMISRDSYYLIPYPYVGFYYLEDYEKSSFYNTFTSERPYYYEVYPQDIFTKALPGGTVIPKGKMSGLVYFKINLNAKKGVKLLAYKPGTSKASPADFTFPFKIE